MQALLLKKTLLQHNTRWFSTSAAQKRYFLVEYNYVEDAYYKRSKDKLMYNSL
jgi:hypothetical protein